MTHWPGCNTEFYLQKHLLTQNHIETFIQKSVIKFKYGSIWHIIPKVKYSLFDGRVFHLSSLMHRLPWVNFSAQCFSARAGETSAGKS